MNTTTSVHQMKYIPLSEMEMLEEVVSEELNNSFSYPKKIFGDVLGELRERNQALNEEIIFLRNQIVAKDETLSKIMDLSPLLHTQITNITKDMMDVKMENKDLRDMVLFLTKQVNRKDSTISVSESGVPIDADFDDEGQCTDDLHHFEDILQDISSTTEFTSSTPNESTRKAPQDAHITKRKPRQKISYDEQMKFIREKRHTEYLEYREKKMDSGRELGEWEKHNRGFASKYMKQKCEYTGGGLGKNEDGIIDPIHVEMKKTLGGDDRNQSSISMSSGRLNDTNQDDHQTVLKNQSPSNNDRHTWPAKTTLIAGSSIVSGIQESRLRKYKCKVRAFPGATIEDMYDYLTPLLKKKPTNIILHVSSNDSPYKSSDEIVQELIELKKKIELVLPGVKVFLSTPTLRFDNGLANSVLREVTLKLRELFCDVVVNDNIDRECLGHKGLHLNEKGSGRLARNFISLMQGL